MIDTIRWIHVTCAILTGISFFVRGIWMWQGSPLLQARLTRILPHAIDTLLLASALVMVWQWSLHPLAMPWLLAKIIALLLYIGCGLMAFRFGPSPRIKRVFWLLALVVLAFIYVTARTKTVFLLPLAV